VNHQKQPSYWIKEIFKIGTRGKDYDKVIDGMAILKNNDLMIAIKACPELKAFVNRIIVISNKCETEARS